MKNNFTIHPDIIKNIILLVSNNIKDAKINYKKINNQQYIFIERGDFDKIEKLIKRYISSARIINGNLKKPYFKLN